LKHHYANINGIRMHYVTHGEGAPVLLLHGFPEYWGVWKQVMADLGKDHHVIAPDLRGYNLTSRPEGVEAYRIEHLVEDVRGLVAHLGVKDVHLVAQDWGALVGWSFVLRHPQLVRSYTAIDITHPALFNRELRHNPAHQQVSQYMLSFRDPGAADFIAANDFTWPKQALIDVARQHGADLSEADAAELVEAWRQPGAINAGLNWYRAAMMGPPDGKGHPGGSNLVEGLSPQALKVTLPVLVLWAELEAYLLPSGLEGLEEYVADLTVKRIPGGTHSVTLEKPREVSQFVREFVSRRR
jgi:pimeloyl-ACP methyl ester carboxylesterase